MNSGRTTAIRGGTGIQSTPANNTGTRGQRRSSASSATKFAGLMEQKRNSLDAEHIVRRESFNEMRPTPGFIGKLWHNFTMGTPSPK